MQGKFICQKDCENLKPIDVFHKEFSSAQVEKHAETLCNRHTLFRKKILLKKAETAILKITADDYFKLYINGIFVAQGPPPSYPQNYYFMENGNIVKYIDDNGRYFSYFPASSESPYVHVRPHAQNRDDALPLPVADKLTGLMRYPKHSFWLNRSYVLKIISREE